MIKTLFRNRFVRFATVGVVSNALLYLFYLLLTFTIGLDYKIAMTVVYILGVMSTFCFNRTWSFNHSGTAHTAFVRYVLAYVIGYILNFLLLWFSVDRLKLPHERAQAAAIIIVAFCMFLLNRNWVFYRHSEVTRDEAQPGCISSHYKP